MGEAGGTTLTPLTLQSWSRASYYRKRKSTRFRRDSQARSRGQREDSKEMPLSVTELKQATGPFPLLLKVDFYTPLSLNSSGPGGQGGERAGCSIRTLSVSCDRKPAYTSISQEGSYNSETEKSMGKLALGAAGFRDSNNIIRYISHQAGVYVSSLLAEKHTSFLEFW